MVVVVVVDTGRHRPLVHLHGGLLAGRWAAMRLYSFHWPPGRQLSAQLSPTRQTVVAPTALLLLLAGACAPATAQPAAAHVLDWRPSATATAAVMMMGQRLPQLLLLQQQLRAAQSSSTPTCIRQQPLLQLQMLHARLRVQLRARQQQQLQQLHAAAASRQWCSSLLQQQLLLLQRMVQAAVMLLPVHLPCSSLLLWAAPLTRLQWAAACSNSS